MAIRISSVKKEDTGNFCEIKKAAVSRRKHVVCKNVISAARVSKEDFKMTKHFRETVKVAVKGQKEKGLPVAKYDLKAGKAFLEYPDGYKKYVEEKC